MRCSCSVHPLINSNLGFAGVSVAHLFGGNPFGSVVYFLLGLLSSVYHYTTHVFPTDTNVPWEIMDKAVAWVAMFFNAWIVYQNPTYTKFFGAAICFSSLILYFLGGRAIARGDMKTYIWTHCLWHWCGALGAFIIFL